jgi:hypothetical protein
MVNEVLCSAVPLVCSHMSETRLEDKGVLSQQARVLMAVDTRGVCR